MSTIAQIKQIENALGLDNALEPMEWRVNAILQSIDELKRIAGIFILEPVTTKKMLIPSADVANMKRIEEEVRQSLLRQLAEQDEVD